MKLEASAFPSSKDYLAKYVWKTLFELISMGFFASAVYVLIDLLTVSVLQLNLVLGGFLKGSNVSQVFEFFHPNL